METVPVRFPLFVCLAHKSCWSDCWQYSPSRVSGPNKGSCWPLPGLFCGRGARGPRIPSQGVRHTLASKALQRQKGVQERELSWLTAVQLWIVFYSHRNTNTDRWKRRGTGRMENGEGWTGAAGKKTPNPDLLSWRQTRQWLTLKEQRIAFQACSFGDPEIHTKRKRLKCGKW